MYGQLLELHALLGTCTPNGSVDACTAIDREILHTARSSFRIGLALEIL